MRVAKRNYLRRVRIYEAALIAGYANLMTGVILAFMGAAIGALPLATGLTLWSFAGRYGRRYRLDE